MADVSIAASGTITASGVADLTLQSLLAASGTISLSGSAWASVRSHGQDTLVATGSIRIAAFPARPPSALGPSRAPIRLNTGETWQPTDADGWTAPDVTPPDIREDA